MTQHNPYDDAPIETIAGVLDYSPQTDIPFGKTFVMGLVEYIIYDSAIEHGYASGITAHLKFIKDRDGCAPVMPDDHQLVQVLDAFTPKDLDGRNRAIWRAHFIAGWVSVFLGLVREGLNA